MHVAAKEFADDPCASAKRAAMVRAARALLSSVTRLLCVADMADVYRLLASLKLVSFLLVKTLDGVSLNCQSVALQLYYYVLAG